jgi:hypothetical protein
MAKAAAAKKKASKPGNVVKHEEVMELPVSLTEKEDIARRKDLEAGRSAIPAGGGT